jgi:hypothetical protein
MELQKYYDEILINQRVCPMPYKWAPLYDLICKKTRTKDLPSPLILAAWYGTLDYTKLERFKLHVEHAYKYSPDIFILVQDFINGLSEREWHHYSQ